MSFFRFFNWFRRPFFQRSLFPRFQSLHKPKILLPPLLAFSLPFDLKLLTKEKSTVAKEHFRDLFEERNYKNVKTFKVDTIVPGDRKTYPTKGKTVKIHFTTWFLDGTIFDTTRHETSSVEQPYEFQLGSGTMIEGLELAIKRMSKGERAMVVVGPDLAFGEKGREDIPGNSVLVFDIILLDVHD